MKRPRVWQRVPAKYRPSDAEKAALRQRCDAFLAEALIPRFEPQFRPSDEWNSPIGLRGEQRGAFYRFIQVWRTPTVPAETWAEGFARIALVGPDRCDVAYFRHTGVWHTIEHGVPLEAALSAITDEPLLHPSQGM